MSPLRHSEAPRATRSPGAFGRLQTAWAVTRDALADHRPCIEILGMPQETFAGHGAALFEAEACHATSRFCPSGAQFVLV